MLSSRSAVYIKQDDPKYFFGSVSEEHFFCVVEVEDGMTAKQGFALMDQMREEVHDVRITSLTKFESWIQDIIIGANVPATFSLAAGYLHGTVLYVKTMGGGCVYIRRDKDYTKLIVGDKSASGHAQAHDLFTFATIKHVKNFKNEKEIQKLVGQKHPEEIVHAIETYETDIDEKDNIALFIELRQSKKKAVIEEEKPAKPEKKEEVSTLPPEDAIPGESEEIVKQTPDPAVLQQVQAAQGLQLTDTLGAETDPPESDGQITDTTQPEESTQKAPYRAETVTLLDGDSVSVDPPADAGERTPFEEEESRLASRAQELEGGEFPPESGEDATASQQTDTSQKKKMLTSLLGSIPRPQLKIPSIGNGSGGTSTGSGIGARMKSKKWLFVVAIILLLVLAQSVFFSHRRQQEKQLRDKVEASQQVVEEKIQQAEDISFLNAERSILLLNEAREEIQSLTATLSEDEQQKVQKDIEQMEQSITTFEEELLKKEEASYTEFYDLALESQDAAGSAMFLADGTVSIVDPGNQVIYLLSLEDKSLEERPSPGIGSDTVVALYKDDLFFLTPSKGVYRFVDEEEIEKVIEADEDWGSVVDMGMYFGNIYLLDAENSDIYKYVVVQNGYADKATYFFSGTEVNLQGATAMALDTSIYVAQPQQVQKFTRGEPDEFSTTFPKEDLQIDQIYTDEEAGKVYALDTTSASIYVLGKSGAYEREIYTEMLKEATDLFVYDKDIYVLAGAKIYLITDGE